MRDPNDSARPPPPPAAPVGMSYKGTLSSLYLDIRRESHVDLGADAHLGRAPRRIEVEHHSLTLPEHPEDGPLQRVRGEHQLLAVGVADHDALTGGRVVGADHALHGAADPAATASGPCRP